MNELYWHSKKSRKGNTRLTVGSRCEKHHKEANGVGKTEVAK